MRSRREAPAAVWALSLLAVLGGGATWVACSSGSHPASAGSTGATGIDGGGSVVCASSLTACGGYCVDVSTSVLHCGACGAACPVGQSCRSGACAPSVLCNDGGLTECQGKCVDLKSSTASCGDCQLACGKLQACLGGVCAQPCPSATVFCAGYCIEPANHAKFCGATAGCGDGAGSKGQECASVQQCIAGKCTTECPQGETGCPANGSVACVDTRTSNSDCGSCGHSCGAGTCSRGICCPVGQESCQGQCKNTQIDPTSCGGCGVKCDVGQTCNAGTCAP